MKIIIELDIIQSSGGLTEKIKLENTEAIIKKHFGVQCDLIDNKPTYFRNLGNIYGNADLIVKLSKTELIQ
jgi:5'(3')-deoxyribonucleotidase